MKMLGKASILLLGIVFLLLLAHSAQAQNSNSGEIKGRVTDSSGAVLPDVVVKLTNVQTGVVSVSKTNSDGLYDFPSIVPGSYSMLFSDHGFHDLIRDGIVLDVTTIAVDATLQIGTATEQIIVTAAAPQLQTETSDQEMTIEKEDVINAPVVGGIWYNELTATIPGVNGGGGQDAAGQGIGINGTQGYEGTWLMEGMTATMPRDNNASNNYPPLDAIGEVSINSANYGAQYGNGLATFNVTLKSGANRWHGSAFEFNQNNIYDAVNYFTAKGSPVAPLRWNEYGGSVGGPIIKDKLFFYFTYQRNPSSSPYTSILTVPTDAMKGGDFSAFSTPIYNPATTSCTGPGNTGSCTRTAFTGNKITTTLDPVAVAIQKFFPEPNYGAAGATSNNYNYSGSVPSLNTWYVGKVDYNMSDSNRLSASVFYYPASLLYTVDAFCHLGFDCTPSKGNGNIQGQLTDTWTLSPTAVNEFRIGQVRELDQYSPKTYGGNYLTQIGMEPAYGKNAPGNIFPDISVSAGGGPAAIGIGPGTHSLLASGVEQVGDIFTLIRGRHTLKMGGEFDKRYQNYGGWPDVESGNFAFDGIGTSNYYPGTNTPNLAATGIPYADFVLGQVYGWYVDQYPLMGAYQFTSAGFVQDDFHLFPRLTLNVGIRYEWDTGWGEQHKRFGVFDPTLVNVASYLPAGTLGALLYGGQQGRETIQKGVSEWAPRVGFSWSPRPDLAVRGSYGIFDAPHPAEAGSDVAIGAGVYDAGAAGYGNFPTFPLQTGPPAGTVIYPTTATLTNASLNYTAVDYYPATLPDTYTQEILLSIQKQFPGQIVLDTSYVYTRGMNLNFTRDIDQVPASELSAGTQPYPQFSSVGAVYFDGHSNYNALQLRGTKRMSQGVTFVVNYAWSKTMDTGTSNGHATDVDVWQNAYDPAANYGTSLLNVANSLTGSATYELPFGQGRQFVLHGVANEALGGWRLSGVFQAHGGLPFTPTMSYDGSNSKAVSCYCGFAWLPNVVGNAKVSHPSVTQWFNPAAFAAPTADTFGDGTRNSVYGPPWRDVDLSIGKTFTFPEKVNFELRGDVFDSLNNANFAQPNSSISSTPALSLAAGSGTITSANSYRQMQVGGRLTF